jgi:ribosome-associated heat shock protein Hsp15
MSIGADHRGAEGNAQRLDKWLWFARVAKTRTLAAGLVAAGKVRVDRARVHKPSQTLRPGAVVTIAVNGRVRVLKVLAPGVRRGPPAEALGLYEDLTPQQAAAAAGNPEPVGAHRARGCGRPTKRDRRQIDRLKGHAG